MWVLWHVPYSSICVWSLRLTSLIWPSRGLGLTHLMLPILDHYLKISAVMSIVIVLCTSCPRFPMAGDICWCPPMCLLLVSHWNSEFSGLVFLLRIVQFNLWFGELVHHLLELPNLFPLLFFIGFSFSSLFCQSCSAGTVSAGVLCLRWHAVLL